MARIKIVFKILLENMIIRKNTQLFHKAYIFCNLNIVLNVLLTFLRTNLFQQMISLLNPEDVSFDSV